MSKIVTLTRNKKTNNTVKVIGYEDYKGLVKQYQKLQREHDNLFLAYELLLQDFERIYNTIDNNEEKIQ